MLSIKNPLEEACRFNPISESRALGINQSIFIDYGVVSCSSATMHPGKALAELISPAVAVDENQRSLLDLVCISYVMS